MQDQLDVVGALLMRAHLLHTCDLRFDWPTALTDSFFSSILGLNPKGRREGLVISDPSVSSFRIRVFSLRRALGIIPLNLP